MERSNRARHTRSRTARSGGAGKVLASLALLGASLVAYVALRGASLGPVPAELVGWWEPVERLPPGTFLHVGPETVEWSAGPGQVAGGQLRGVERLGRDEEGTSFALHYLGEHDEVETLRVELLSTGGVVVGGRRSVEWRRGRDR